MTRHTQRSVRASDLRPPTSDLRPPTSVLRPPSSDLRPPSPGWLRNRASNAFTLIEMLVVLGILGILMSVAFSGLGAARLQAQVARANAEVRQLVSAWLSYEAAYDDWPTQVQGDDIETSESAIQELLGKNDTETVYLNVQLVNGAFRDPWGTPYRFRLLTDNSDNQSAEEFAASITFPNRHRQQAQ